MKKRKLIFILSGLFFAVFVGLICAYGIYAQTLLNGCSEETIISSLSKDINNPIQILAIEKYNDYLAVLYKSPLDDDPYNDYAHFEIYKKCSLYKDRYKHGGGIFYGNVTCPNAIQFDVQETTDTKCFFMILHGRKPPALFMSRIWQATM